MKPWNAPETHRMQLVWWHISLNHWAEVWGQRWRNASERWDQTCSSTSRRKAEASFLSPSQFHLLQLHSRPHLWFLKKGRLIQSSHLLANPQSCRCLAIFATFKHGAKILKILRAFRFQLGPPSSNPTKVEFSLYLTGTQICLARRYQDLGLPYLVTKSCSEFSP